MCSCCASSRLPPHKVAPYLIELHFVLTAEFFRAANHCLFLRLPGQRSPIVPDTECLVAWLPARLPQRPTIRCQLNVFSMSLTTTAPVVSSNKTLRKHTNLKQRYQRRSSNNSKSNGGLDRKFAKLSFQRLLGLMQ